MNFDNLKLAYLLFSLAAILNNNYSKLVQSLEPRNLLSHSYLSNIWQKTKIKR